MRTKKQRDAVRFSPQCTTIADHIKNQGYIREGDLPPDVALILRFICRRAAIALAQRATCSMLAPSFIGSWRTSLRHAPRATAAITAARTIAPFIVLFSWNLLTRYLLSNRQVGAGSEFQWLITFLATASAKSNSGDYGRDDDHALYVHGLLSYHVFGNRTYSGTGV